MYFQNKFCETVYVTNHIKYLEGNEICGLSTFKYPAVKRDVPMNAVFWYCWMNEERFTLSMA